MSTTSTPVDIEALGKLLSLAKSFEEVFPDKTSDKAVERVLIRNDAQGHLSFQVKGGMLWRFFTITLSGREKAYDLGQNFAQLQNLFRSLKPHSDLEIRRAAQGMCMYGQTVIDTQDAVATLASLQETLNSMIDHIKRKKMRQPTDEERKKSIVEALETMKIDWKPSLVKESKKPPLQKKLKPK
jgi:hypothetical protein